MYLGRVIGTVVSTSKNEDLIGMKLLIVERLDEHLQRSGETEIAVDSVGAGNGEIGNVPVDKSIVGIVDTVETM